MWEQVVGPRLPAQDKKRITQWYFGRTFSCFAFEKLVFLAVMSDNFLALMTRPRVQKRKEKKFRAGTLMVARFGLAQWVGVWPSGWGYGPVGGGLAQWVGGLAQWVGGLAQQVGGLAQWVGGGYIPKCGQKPLATPGWPVTQPSMRKVVVMAGKRIAFDNTHLEREKSVVCVFILLCFLF